MSQFHEGDSVVIEAYSALDVALEQGLPSPVGLEGTVVEIIPAVDMLESEQMAKAIVGEEAFNDLVANPWSAERGDAYLVIFPMGDDSTGAELFSADELQYVSKLDEDLVTALDQE